jgi:hypothetical protein
LGIRNEAPDYRPARGFEQLDGKNRGRQRVQIIALLRRMSLRSTG